MTQVTILSNTPVLVGHALLLPGETHEVNDGALQAAITQYGEDAFRTPASNGDEVQSTSEPNTNGTVGSGAPEPDDLTVIKGIGPAIREQLVAQGIHTFAELAAANPVELAAAIQGSEKQVEAWRSEAQELVKGDGA